MESSSFESSDSGRTSRTLRHAQYVTFDEPLALEREGQIPKVTVAYETYGQLNEDRDNAVLMCHALSGDSHVAEHDSDDDPGWWEIMVGPGKPIDTNRYFVICPNVLGGCRGTTGPNSINPETGKPYGADFPIITIGDIVETQRRLIDHLGIGRLLAVVGGSLGGHMTLTWATRYADRLVGAVAVATSPRLTSQALAFDVVGRNAILRDPEFHDGRYYEGDGPKVGLAIARMLGHITYLSREAMMQKFDAHRMQARDIRTQFETKFSVGSYLAYQGDRFGERFDANTYLALSMAMDLFDLGETPEKLAETLSASECRWLVLSYTSDWLFPPFQSQQLVNALLDGDKPVSYCNVKSDCGHDAFLLEDEFPIYGEMVRAFLANLFSPAALAAATSKAEAEEAAQACHSPRSIFHHRHRLDYDTIIELIPPGASVLDLGAGTGGLLSRLRQRDHARRVGVELDEQEILTGIRRGLDIVQGDLNQGLSMFGDKQFDYVVLSQTLQTVTDVEKAINEMLRVGWQGIVSFPNLGYHKFRSQIAEEGRAPRIDAELGYQWYNTPNVRFLTIADFEEFCHDKGFKIHQWVALDTEADTEIHDNPHLNADVAIAVLSR